MLVDGWIILEDEDQLINDRNNFAGCEKVLAIIVQIKLEIKLLLEQDKVSLCFGSHFSISWHSLFYSLQFQPWL